MQQPPRISVSCRQLDYKKCLLIAAASAYASSFAVAAEWRITPTIQGEAVYTDNVRLAPSGSEESDFITEVAPGVSITGRGARLQVNLDYALRYRAYAKNSDANGFSNALRSSALWEVLERNLFVDARASITEQNISTLGPQATSDVNLTPNQAEVRQVSLSPYWTSRLGSFANLQARYSWDRLESSGTTSSLDTESQTFSVAVSNGLQFNDLGWSLAYSLQNIESTEGQFSERELETITATGSYRLLPTLSGLLTIGRDDNTFGSAIGSTGGNFYSAGLLWAPSSRTQIRGEVGKRYFGDTASFNASHRTRLTTWAVSYVEQITATPRLLTLPVNLDTASTVDRLFLATVPDPIEREQVVQAFIAANGLPAFLPSSVDFLTDRVTLSKRLQGIFGLRGARGSLFVTVFRDDRSAESTGVAVVETDPFSITDTVVQTGYSATLSWRFSERTAGVASLGQNRSQYEDVDRTDINTNLRVGVSRQLQPRLRGSVEYRFLNRDTTRSGGDVRENAITGTLSYAF